MCVSKGPEKSAITPEMEAISKWTWCLLGLLDSIAGLLQVIGVAYSSNGAVATLCMQAAPAVSLIVTKLIIPATKYRISQYVGATVTTLGIVVVLLPDIIDPGSSGSSSSDSHLSPGIAAVLIIVSCVPMCVSSVYKEIALKNQEVDVWYCNGWVAVFQLLFSFIFLYPFALVQGIAAKDVWTNLGDGFVCYGGRDSLSSDDCRSAPLLLSLYLVANIGFNVLILVLIALGSANLLWLAITLTVPLATLSFMLPVVPPSARPSTDPKSLIALCVGLVIICAGLGVYRFWPRLAKAVGLQGAWLEADVTSSEDADVADDKKTPLVAGADGADGLAVSEDSNVQGLTPLLGGAGRHMRAMHKARPGNSADETVAEPDL